MPVPVPEPRAAAPASWPERLLARFAEPPDAAQDRVLDFQRILLLYGAVRSLVWVAIAPRDGLLLLGAALVFVVAAGLALRGGRGTFPARLALPAVLAQVAFRFPHTANHLFLEAVCIAVLALLPRRSERDEAPLALAALRLVTALVLFHTGFQKLVYGLYFQGEFLAFMAATQERFGRVFQFFLPDAELARLEALDRKETGAGPYRVAAPAFVLASNLVWMAELTLPALLAWPPTRVLATLAGIALMLGIQVAALELGFALLFVNLLLLFLPGRWNARLFPFFAAFLLYGLLSLAGSVPGHPADWNLL